MSSFAESLRLLGDASRRLGSAYVEAETQALRRRGRVIVPRVLAVFSFGGALIGSLGLALVAFITLALAWLFPLWPRELDVGLACILLAVGSGFALWGLIASLEVSLKGDKLSPSRSDLQPQRPSRPLGASTLAETHRREAMAPPHS